MLIFNYDERIHVVPSIFLDVFYDQRQRSRPSKDPGCTRHGVKRKHIVSYLIAHGITQNGSFNLRLVYPTFWEK